MKKKSDIILYRLRKDFRIFPHGDIKKHTNLYTFDNDDDLVLVKRGEDYEVQLVITRNELNISPSFHSQYFSDMSEPYFKKHLKVFLEQETGQDYGSFRYHKYEFEWLQNLHIPIPSVAFHSIDDLTPKQKRMVPGVKMDVVWVNPSKPVESKRNVRLRVVA